MHSSTRIQLRIVDASSVRIVGGQSVKSSVTPVNTQKLENHTHRPTTQALATSHVNNPMITYTHNSTSNNTITPVDSSPYPIHPGAQPW
eukprot:m.1586462 g.1586462  ORF g.1586462 m.1586462 type:complete len:89 (-) comp25328_c1_seq3:8492-8758(-)